MTNPNDPVGIGDFQQFVIEKGESRLDKCVEIREHSKGLTKREYFAGLAMQGIFSAHRIVIEGDEEKLVRAALRYADALIAELSK